MACDICGSAHKFTRVHLDTQRTVSLCDACADDEFAIECRLVRDSGRRRAPSDQVSHRYVGTRRFDWPPVQPNTSSPGQGNWSLT